MDKQTIFGMLSFAVGSLSLVFHEECLRLDRRWKAFCGIDRKRRPHAIGDEASIKIVAVLFTLLGLALMFHLVELPGRR